MKKPGHLDGPEVNPIGGFVSERCRSHVGNISCCWGGSVGVVANRRTDREPKTQKRDKTRQHHPLSGCSVHKSPPISAGSARSHFHRVAVVIFQLFRGALFSRCPDSVPVCRHLSPRNGLYFLANLMTSYSRWQSDGDQSPKSWDVGRERKRHIFYGSLPPTLDARPATSEFPVIASSRFFRGVSSAAHSPPPSPRLTPQTDLWAFHGTPSPPNCMRICFRNP